MVLLLSGLLFAFNLRTQTTLDIAETFRESEQARNCAQAGLSIAVAAIRDGNNIGADPRLAGLRTGKDSFSIGEGICSVTIMDESGRLNVNILKDQEGNLNRTQIDRLLKLIDLVNRQHRDQERIGYGMVAAVIDWIDRDDEKTHLPFVSGDNQGAENRYYESLTPPYRCKNRAMDTIEELCWVKGMTREAFGPMRDLLTTVGDGQVNINAAPKLVIQSLSEQMDSALAQMIIRQRERKPFETLDELKRVPGMTDNIYLTIKDSITVDPSEQIYRVNSQGSVENRTYRIEAVLRRNTETENVDIVLYKES